MQSSVQGLSHFNLAGRHQSQPLTDGILHNIRQEQAALKASRKAAESFDDSASVATYSSSAGLLKGKGNSWFSSKKLQKDAMKSQVTIQ